MTVPSQPLDSDMQQTNQENAKAWQTKVEKGGTAHIADTINIYTERYQRVGVPFQAPPLPHPYIDRPELRAAVKAKLIAEESATPGTLVVSAIFGLGGIGKSVLATVLAHDPEVQARFPDGILWATLGQQPDILPFLSGWIQSLKDYDYKPNTIDSASLHLRTLLYDKKVLLVVDDVWNPDHMEAFRVGGSGCRVLVTTREAKIPDAERYDMDTMTPEQSLELLLQKAQCLKPDLIELQQAKTIAEEVGYLPLALELAGSRIADGMLWSELLEDLQAEITHLESLDDLAAPSVSSEKNRKRFSLLASFNLSLRQLSPAQLRQFAWLGVLPEDVRLTQEMAATLWDIAPQQAGAVLRMLWSKALLLPGVKQLDQKLAYRLHDLMHDLAKGLITASPVSIEDDVTLAGLGLSLSAAHQALLSRYWTKTQQEQWHTLPGDGYIHAHLTWHFEQAGQLDAIHQLLQETTFEGRNGWYEACERLGQTANFITDVARAWQLAEQQYEQNPAQSIALQLRYALIKTTLKSLAQSIPAELIGALIEKGIWTPAQGLAYVQQVDRSNQRAAILQQLAGKLPNTLLPIALEVVRSIQDELDKATSLGVLGQYLPEELLSEALKIAREVQDEFNRAKMLIGLAPCLLEVIPEALKTVRSIQDESKKADTLSELAPHLPEELLPKALRVVLSIRDESHRAKALIGLAPRLPEGLFTEALKAVLSIGQESNRVEVLIGLAPYLPEKLLPEALEIVREIQNESLKADALEKLADFLPGELLVKVLEAADELWNEASLAIMLIRLTPCLPDESLSEVLKGVYSIQKESDRAMMLIGLVPYLPEKLWTEVLKVTREIQDESNRANILAGLAESLPKKLLPEVLAIAQSIKFEDYRCHVLVRLAPHFPEVLPEALAMSRRTFFTPDRIDMLIKLAPYFPKVVPEALALIRKLKNYHSSSGYYGDVTSFSPEGLLPKKELFILRRETPDESSRVDALKKLAPYLPEELLPKALAVACEIQDTSHQVAALGALALYLPERLLSKALMVTCEIQDTSNQVAALTKLIPYSSYGLLTEALEIAHETSNPLFRATALIKLANYLPEVITEALTMVRKIQDESDQATTLIELIPYLPRDLLPKALKVANKLGVESGLTVLVELAPYLPEVIPETLRRALQLFNKSARITALRKLAPYLPEGLLIEVLIMARSSQSESLRAGIIGAIGPFLPKEQLPEALAIARLNQNKTYRAAAFLGLAQLMPEAIPEALAVISLTQEPARGPALRELIPYLPKELLPEALAVAKSIRLEPLRIPTLIELAQYFPEAVSEVLEEANSIEDESNRAYALIYLAEYFPEGVLPDVLEMMWLIRDESDWVSALDYLAQWFPEELLPDVLEMTRPIRDESNKAFILSCLAERLDLNNFELWCEFLHALANLSRKEFINIFPKLAAAILALGGKAALEEGIVTMREVCQQWR